MKTKLFKSFMAMLAIATAFAFVGCSEDDTDSTAVDPQIEISVSNLAFTQAEESKTVDVTSNSEWKAEVPADASWLTVTPTSGNGNKTVSVAVAANATGAARSAVVKFSAMHPTYGAWDNKTLTISQSAGDQQIEELETIFNDNFDKVLAEKDGNYWPYFDAKYMNPQGSAAAGVTYAVSEKNITVRANSASNSEYSDYEGSGSNNIFFGKTPNKFVIENIALPADKDCYVLTFGSEMYDNNNKEAVYDLAKFHVYVSGDNTKWSEVTYAFAEGDDLKGRWNDATASFKLAAVPEKLSIKFVADVASVYRLDDVALATGGEGAQTIDLAQGTEEEDPGQSDEPSDKKEVTVTEAISTENGTAVKIKESTVVAVSARSYLLTDGTSYILAYKGEDPGLAVGDKVTVEGSIGAYRNVPQIASPVATKTGHDDSFKHPEATVMDGAAADAFLTETYIKYVKVEGNLVKSGSYWNLAIEGASKAQGSVSYPTAEMCPDSYDGKKVAVYGYTLYQTRDTDVNVIATSIEVLGEGEGGDDEPAEVKKVTVDEFLKAAEDNTVYELTGKIANVVEGKEYYGNFDLVDDSGTVYVYGIKKDGEYGIFETLGLKAGDTITVQGNRGSHKGNPQMTNGVYISHVAGEGGNEGGDEPGHTCDADVCVDFTVAANYPAEFPVASANKIVDRTEYTFGGNKFAFAGSTGAGFYQVTGKEIYVLFGKKGAYVEFPAIEGKSLKKVVATSRKGASATVEVGVTDTEGNAVNGGAAIVWAQTEPYTFTYELTGTTANTAYRLTVANDKNAQITHLALYYVDGDNGSAGEGGDEPDVPEVKEMTIAEVIAAEKDTEFKLKESTVVAISKKGLMLYDGANYIYAYAGSQPEVAVGDKVTVEGKKGSYNNMPQIASPVVTKTGTDASFAHPAVVEMNGAAVDAFQNDVKVQYVKVAGKLTISGGKYFNLAVEGATVQGSLDNPLDAICPADYDGKDLVVYGYTLYTSSSNKYVNIITTAVEVVEPTPGEDEGGSGDGNEDLPLAPSTEWDTKVLGKWTVERAYASPSGLEGEHDKWNQPVAFEYVKLVSDGLPDNRPVIDDVNKNQRYWTPFKKWEAQFIIFNISSEQIAGKPGCYAVIDIVDRAGGGDTNAITANNSYFDSNTETLYFDFVCNSLLYTAKMTNRTDF